MARILVVEDEDLVGRMIQFNLRGEGYDVVWVKRAEEVDSSLESGGFDLIVMDVMLPGLDGIQATRKLRESGIETPILMVTARNQLKDKVKGLDAGADDYLTKPFRIEEFLARIRALMKRSIAPPPPGKKL
ncbi:MAG: response regulator [Pseudomonadota bacterium]